MSKRRYNPTLEEDKTPLVEKLYRESQKSEFLGGGFLDDDDEYQEKREKFSEARQKRVDAHYSSAAAPDNCAKCEKPLFESWLWDKYNCPVCDACRDDTGDHKLIARTEAKAEYLLKDCDLDLRKPPLRFWAKKNPHNPRYGDMKLYLKCQVVNRMLEVYGSQEKFELEKQLRVDQKESRAEKNFEKRLKEMRQHIRGASGSKVQLKNTHEHVYDDEKYDKKKDEYYKNCTLCDFVLTYEKM